MNDEANLFFFLFVQYSLSTAIVPYYSQKQIVGIFEVVVYKKITFQLLFSVFIYAQTVMFDMKK